MSESRQGRRNGAPHEFWSDDDGATWQVAAMIGTVRGRREVVGVTIRSAYDPSDEADFPLRDLLPPSDGSGQVQPKPVTTKVLRAPLAAMLERLRAPGLDNDVFEVRSDLRVDDSFPTVDFEDGDERQAEARIDPHAVADVYLRAFEVGEPPTQAVAAHFGITHDSAAARVRRARAKKLLPPAKRGIASGAPRKRED